MLSTHYRQPLDWKFERLAEAEKTLIKWNNKKESKYEGDLPKQVLNALLDDINTPLSIYEMHQLYKNEKFADLTKACAFFGFVPKGRKDNLPISPELSKKVDNLIKDRNNARLSKNFLLADKIREDLLGAGIIIKDSGQETTWELSANLEIKKLKEL